MATSRPQDKFREQVQEVYREIGMLLFVFYPMEALLVKDAPQFVRILLVLIGVLGGPWLIQKGLNMTKGNES